MSLRPYMMLLFLFFVLAPAHAVAAGQVGGSILYGAGQYRSEVDGEELQKLKSQYGQVGLHYRSQSNLGDSRVGKYTLMLGYEFNILDPTITNSGVKDPAFERIEKGKLLYQGELLLAPGGLPFRLQAYTRDLHQTFFESATGQISPLPIGMQPVQRRQTQETLLTPNILTDINNGTHHELGATLLIGIRNGSYLGNYRDVLSKLPRLMIDYKQVDVSDLSRDFSQQHYRQRDLAFISLNKKDNWIHFRAHDYTDFLNASHDYKSNQVLLGTVDHTLSRQWINLTNWIKISGDLSLTSEKKNNLEFSEDTQHVNLFAISTRQEFKASVLSSFERKTFGESLTQELDLPVYFNYEPNRDSYYRGSLRSEFERHSELGGAVSEGNTWQRERRDVAFDLSSEFFRTRAIIFKPRIKLGVNETDSTQGFNEKLTLEMTNQRRQNSLPWTLGYYLASTQTSNDSDSALYFEQSLYGNVEKNLSKSSLIGFRGSVRSGRGQNENSETAESVSDRLIIDSTGRYLNKTDLDSFFEYNGDVFWDHSGRLMANRLSFSVQGIITDIDNLTLFEVEHLLKMTGRINEFTLASAVERGSEVALRSAALDYLDQPAVMDGADFSWSSKAEYVYTPDRSMRFALAGGVNSLSGEENVMTWNASEKLEYRFYKRNGQSRKLAEISEEFGSEQSAGRSSTGRDGTLFLRMVAALYPTRHLYARIDSELLSFSPGKAGQMIFNAEGGASFEKFQVALSYGRAAKEAESVVGGEVKEERWDLKVKKTF